MREIVHIYGADDEVDALRKFERDAIEVVGISREEFAAFDLSVTDRGFRVYTCRAIAEERLSL